MDKDVRARGFSIKGGAITDKSQWQDQSVGMLGMFECEVGFDEVDAVKCVGMGLKHRLGFLDMGAFFFDDGKLYLWEQIEQGQQGARKQPSSDDHDVLKAGFGDLCKQGGKGVAVGGYQPALEAMRTQGDALERAETSAL